MSAFAARFLVFITSAAVLVLEILAGRLLAPYLGVSIQTFTGIIGVVLAGISAGAWLGGRAADRSTPERLLGPLLIAGGALSISAPAVVSWVGPALGGSGPLEIVIIAGLAFFAPAVVLSAVPPTVVKIRLRSLTETGSVVGGFSAVGTAGAIFGTFATGFVLVAALPSRPIAIALGLGLVAIGALLTVRYGLAPGSGTLVVLVPLVAAALLAARPAPCDRETAYTCARVAVDPNRPTGRVLWSEMYRSSYVDLADPTHLEFRYIRNMASAIESLAPPGPLTAAYIGGGGFTLPGYLEALRPGSRQTVLEIDRILVEIAQQELGLATGEGLTVVTGDARLTMAQQPREAFDVVVGDAFAGLVVPWHLATTEFLQVVADRLTPGGIYLVNVIDFPPLRFVRAEVATLAGVFRHTAAIAPSTYLAGEAGGNFVLVGSHDPIDADMLITALRARDPRADLLVGDELIRFADGARPLRDDFAPVDQLVTLP